MRRLAMMLVVLLTLRAVARAQQPQYDVVIANGRVIDPESRLDATRFVGIRNGKIDRDLGDADQRQDHLRRKGTRRRAGLHRPARARTGRRELSRLRARRRDDRARARGRDRRHSGFLWKSRGEGADQLRRVGRTRPRADGRHEGSVDRTPAHRTRRPPGRERRADRRHEAARRRRPRSRRTRRRDGAAVHARRDSLRSARDVSRGRQVSRARVRSRAVVRHARAGELGRVVPGSDRRQRDHGRAACTSSTSTA